jgi:hypothetical protein
MKRLSRHTVVVLLVALLTSMGGMTLAVVAFGQSATDPDANVPTGDYTGTTPSSTTLLSPYTTTPTTTPTSTTLTQASTTPTTATTNGTTNPVRKHGTTTVPSGGGNLPSRATRSGPTHLAFTGGEPIYVGFAGLGLMLGGLMLHRRRRAATDR